MISKNQAECSAELLVPEVALRKMTSWAWASMMRLRVPTVSGEISMVGSLFSADRTVSLM